MGHRLEAGMFFFLTPNIFFVIGLDSFSHSAYYGGIFHHAEYISKNLQLAVVYLCFLEQFVGLTSWWKIANPQNPF